jgi:hypothetical protein
MPTTESSSHTASAAETAVNFRRRRGVWVLVRSSAMPERRGWQAAQHKQPKRQRLGPTGELRQCDAGQHGDEDADATDARHRR